jgi:rhamnose utilization protein RhaD (predicted bifunctional aldolase and dehydrogenase)/NAD(P)-dependent dehydrogenase (short-subunit alcohol dehydrogenase family)
MRDRWDDAEAASASGSLEQLIYARYLLEQEDTLATCPEDCVSVKLVGMNLLGDEEEILFVSGARQSPDGPAAADYVSLRRKPLLRLLSLEALSPAQLENELACSRTVANHLWPPLDAMVHAGLPYRCILFTRPEPLLAIACAPDGPRRLAQIFQGRVATAPYAASGLGLAKACAEGLQNATPAAVAILAMHQGLFTFGDSARAAYTRLVELVGQAEQYLGRHETRPVSAPAATAGRPARREELAMLRQSVSAAAGCPLILTTHSDPVSSAFCSRADLPALAQAGPATVRQIGLAGQLPMLGQDVSTYQAAWEAATGREEAPAAPRIVLDPDIGLCSLGRSAGEAGLAGRLYRQLIDILLHATALGGYEALPIEQAIEAAERADANAAGDGYETGEFAGEIALITGGASGIGKACVASVLARGAAVVNLDLNPAVTTLYDRPDYLGLQCDLTDEAAVIRCFDQFARTFGGLDMLVLNAGIFPSSCRIESLALDHWQQVMRINLDSNLVLLREAHGLLKRSPRGGRVVVNASKNVPAPGAGAAAYSASKAALTQLARVAALEWGKDHIRLNQIHPDAIFDTGIWSEEVLRARAAHYGMTVQQYKTRNVLGVELNSRFVGELVAEMLGPRFEKITGAQIPVDGGSDRVI